MSPTIVLYPTPSLQQKSAPVKDPSTAEISKLLADLEEAMFEHDGIGIAAPQIGVNLRVFLVLTKDGPLAFINPEILKKSFRRESDEEGCLSIPGVFGIVPRHKKITVRYTTPEGETATTKAEGLFARVIQHENDHIDGVLFIERAKEIVRGEEILEKLKNRK